MGGVINYYHGESGLVLDRQLITNESQTAHVLWLEGDPHRDYAYDYGADIGIDPLLERGDWAVFVRADKYTGIWVRQGLHFDPELQQAIDRVTAQRMSRKPPGVVTTRLRNFWAEEYVSDSTKQAAGGRPTDRPATEVSFFLSFSSANVLLARQVFDDLRYDARVEVWFDLAQPGGSPQHEQDVARWLREAIFSRRGFILLWTETASKSDWVQKEIACATERAAEDPEFRFVLCKLDETPVPADLAAAHRIVDCNGLWPVNGINEELFAAVIGRSGRSTWIEEHRRRGLLIIPDQGSLGYEPFRSDSGRAVSLRHWEEGGEFQWQLDYEKDGVSHTAVGRGSGEAVDLAIRPGDYVGFYICHRAPLGRFWPGVPVWMRSAELEIKPDEIVAEYRRHAGGERNSSFQNLAWELSTQPRRSDGPTRTARDFVERALPRGAPMWLKPGG